MNKKIVLMFCMLLLSVGLLSGCTEKEDIGDLEFNYFTMTGTLDNWKPYDSPGVGGYLLYMSNITFYDGYLYEALENISTHWFSSLNYTNFEMNQFINKNITIYYRSNLYEGWDYNQPWSTEIENIIENSGGIV